MPDNYIKQHILTGWKVSSLKLSPIMHKIKATYLLYDEFVMLSQEEYFTICLLWSLILCKKEFFK